MNRQKLFITILGILFLLVYCVTFCLASPTTTSSKNNMVVTSQHLASEVGLTILNQGGNAIDAAVGVGYALAVVDPCCGNIGGGGFMLIHFANGKNIFINFREKAPLAINPNLYLDKNGQPIPDKTTKGYLAIGVPGTVLGLNQVLKEYGTMSLPQIIAPAIDLAKQGFILQSGDIKLLNLATKDFQAQPNIAKIFLKNGQPYQIGDKLIQLDLANTLEQISEQGSDAFYHGPIGKQIINASQANGGVLSQQDFDQYAIEEMQPVICNYRNYQIISAPPPSSGGVTLCEILAITEAYPLSQLGYHTASSTHDIVEAMRYAYADRNSYLGDPDFINNPISTILSPQHIQQIRQQIKSDQAGNSLHIGFINQPATEKMDTTHYSIVDKYGNAVAVTYTLNGFFGSKVIAGNTGFFLNNEMDDFTLKPNVPNQFGLIQSDKNKIQPGKRPLSSMTPTIILKNNKIFMVLGSAGGSTIITQILEVIENIIDYHMDLPSAVDAPRYHMQWLPDKIYTEPNVFSDDTVRQLQTMGYQLQNGFPSPGKDLTWGAVAAILRDPETGMLYGAMDDRRPGGSAIGN